MDYFDRTLIRQIERRENEILNAIAAGSNNEAAMDKALEELQQRKRKILAWNGAIELPEYQ